MRQLQARTSRPARQCRRLLVLPLACLAACGGGDGAPSGEPVTPNAEGVYAGPITGRFSTGNASPEFRMLVLPDGQYWMLYGQTVGSSFQVAGFVQGTGISSAANFISGSARDFGADPPAFGMVAASFDSVTRTMDGDVSFGTPKVVFSGGPIAGSPYRYRAVASLSSIAGAWLGSNASGETVSLSIQANGNFGATTSGGCAATGTALPRTDGRNVFSITLLQGVGCVLPGQTLRGVLLAVRLTTGQTQLLAAAADEARSVGVLLYANR